MLHPPPALDLPPAPEIGPDAFGQVIGGDPVRIEDRRHQQAVAEHVLPVETEADLVLRELEEHGPHHWVPLLGRLLAEAVDIWNQTELQLGELLQHRHGFFIIAPGDAVRIAPVEPAVRGEQAEGDPTLVEIRAGFAEEPADVVTPERPSRETEGEARPELRRHGSIRRLGIPSPVNGIGLGTGRGRTGEDDRLAFAQRFLEHFEHGPRIEEGV